MNITNVYMMNIQRFKQNSDIRFVYELRKKLNIRKNFTNSNLNTYTDHLKWYHLIFKKNKKNIFFIIRLKTLKIGYLKYDFIKNNYFISIAIKKKYQNQGLAKIALGESEKFFKKKRIFAYVFLKNKKSLSFFKSTGFKIFKTDTKYVCFEKLIK